MINTYTKRGHFQPAARGSISEALAKKGAIAVVAPQSPRPSEMLSRVIIDNGEVDLSSGDLALHELLIAKAYESDRDMQASSYEIPVAECLRFLGPEARRDAILSSLHKMASIRLSFSGEDGRTFEGVQMLTAWRVSQNSETSIGYQFPDPIRWLMRHMPTYGYIELAAIAQGTMRSKYSHMLYKHVAFEVARRPWKEGDSNVFSLSFTPEELADIVGFPRIKGAVPFGKLHERVISKILADFAGVRKFDLSITYDGDTAPKKGRTVNTVELSIKIHPDTHHIVRGDTRLSTKGAKIGAPDAPRYRINSVFWLRIPRKFRSLGLAHFTASASWFVALSEAIDERPLTSEYDRRQYRGRNLLAAIDANGVEAAAWGFFAEETELGADICNSVHVAKHLPRADKARLARLTKSKKSKPSSSARPLKKEAVQAPSKPANDEASFENCTHVYVDIDEAASTAELDDFVYKPLNQIAWNGTRRITLRAYYTVPGTNVRQCFDFRIAPETEDELHLALRKVGKWIDTPFYRIVENEAA